MAVILDYAVNFYNYTMKMRDPRTNNWFLIDDPWPTMTIVAFYVYFSASLGPWLMKDRKPMELKRTMICYNIGLVLLSAYLVVDMLIFAYLIGYNIRYQPNDLSNNPLTLGMIRTEYVGYVMKIIELMDTVFFVLRKKTNQISILHLFHHGSMPINLWILLRFFPGGHHCGVAACMNCYIHVLMYSYYALAAMGPKYRKYLWIKRYLTQMQIAQFVIVLIHVGQLPFIESNYPIGIMAYGLGIGCIFLLLFVHYYINEYFRKSLQQVTSYNTESTKKFD